MFPRNSDKATAAVRNCRKVKSTCDDA